MDNSNNQTVPALQLSDIYKALFVSFYFKELKSFLSDFDITPSGNNTLNMKFLTAAYDHNRKEDFRDHCKWNLGKIKDSDLMLAIEEYFDITSREYEGEDLCKERNNTLGYLFNNDEGRQINLGDHTFRAILAYFGVDSLIEADHPEMRGIVRAFRKKLQGYLPEKYRSYWYALDLHACLRNWQGHAHTPRFYGIELHLYHRYVLYTYIGLAYYCRKLWLDPDSKKILESKNLSEPEAISQFNIPGQKIHVEIISNGNNIIRCREAIGSKSSGTRRDIEVTGLPAKQVAFDLDVRKYQENFNIVVTREEEAKPIPIPVELDYKSWFLSYNIILPKNISSHYSGGDVSENYATLFELLAKLQNKDDKIKQLIQNEFEQFKKLWIASVTDENENTRKQLNTVLQEKLTELNQKTDKNIAELKKCVENIHNDISIHLEKYQKTLDDFREWTEEILQQHVVLNKKISCFFYGVTLLLAIAFPCWALFDNFYANIIWLQNRWFLCIWTFVLTLLSVLIFASLQSNQNLIVKVKRIKTYQWLCIALIPLFFIGTIAAFQYKTPKSLFENYAFRKSNVLDKDNKVLEFLEEYIARHPKDDDAIICLVNYSLDYDGDEERAWDLVAPLLEDHDAHPKSLVAIAEVYFAKNHLEEAYAIIKKYKKLYQNMSSVPAINRLEGLLYITPAIGLLDYQKGVSLLKLADEQGDVEATYWLGHLRSNLMGTWKSSYYGGEKLFSLDAVDYDLIKAIAYLKKAANHGFPKAAVELGTLYLDLNINDSAQVYYEKALAMSDNLIKDEINYRLGLLGERRGEYDNSFMQEAIDREYEPALFHKAKHTKDSTIFYYKKLEKHAGYKERTYIPSIVFCYLTDGSTKEALECLQRAHPNAGFSERFVEAMQALYSSDQQAQLKGRQMMISLSEECKFARMLALYWELKGQLSTPIKDIQAIKEKISALEGIGQEIPFAYSLAAYVLKELGADYFEESDNFAQKAIIAGHPSGSAVLIYIPKDYYKKIESEINAFHMDNHVYSGLKDAWDSNSVSLLMKRRNTIQLGLRHSIPSWTTRSVFINYGQKIDFILNATTENDKIINSFSGAFKDYPIDNLRFWSDVAMGINDFEEEGWMLYQYESKCLKAKSNDIDVKYRGKLIDSMLNQIKTYESFYVKPIQEQLADTKTTLYVSQFRHLMHELHGVANPAFNFITNIINNMPESFRDEMLSKYSNDKKIKEILSQRQIQKGYILLGQEPYSINDSPWLDNDYRALLEEWSLVEEGRVSVVW